MHVHVGRVDESLTSASATEGGRRVMRWEDLNAPAPAVTAYLNVTYRAPLPSGTRCLLRVRHRRTEGRKVFFEARLEENNGGCGDISNGFGGMSGVDGGGANDARIFAEASCLMIVVSNPKSRL